MLVKYRQLLLTAAFLVLFSFSAEAEVGREQCGFVRFFNKVGNWFEGNLTKNLDTAYISLPVRPWIVGVNYKVSGMRHNFYDSHYPDVMEIDDGSGNVSSYIVPKDSKLSLFTNATHAVGVGLGYRSLNLRYYQTVSNKLTYSLSVASCGNKFGGEFSFMYSESMHAKMRITDYEDVPGDTEFDLEDKGFGDIGFSRYYVSAYYVLSPRKFSYNAGLRSALIQKRSAGSFVVSAMYYRTAIYFENSVPFTISTFRTDGQIINNELGISFGYAHNFVIPKWRNLMFHISAMPMFTVSVKNDFRGDKFIDEEATAHNPTYAYILDIYKDQDNFAKQHGVGFALQSHFSITLPVSERFILKLDSSFIWVDSGSQSGFRSTTVDLAAHFECGFRF